MKVIRYKHSLSSRKWLERHFNDQYVRQVKMIGVRSRSWFKLDQINNADSLFSSGMMVMDLGSAPGGWSEYAKKKIGKHGHVIASDMLFMNNIHGVDFFQGDCCNSKVLQTLVTWVYPKKVDVVLSDMCPNITGVADIDVPKSIHLGRMALEICKYVLVSGGTFLVKILQGEDFNEYCHDVRCLFNIVRIRKPDASRIHSREVYIVAKGYRV